MADDQAGTQPEPAPRIDAGKPAVSPAQAQSASLSAPSPDAPSPAVAHAGRVLAPGERVTLAPVPPLGSLTLPPLEDGGESLVIEEAGTEVDAATAVRAREAAVAAGFRLREL